MSTPRTPAFLSQHTARGVTPFPFEMGTKAPPLPPASQSVTSPVAPPSAAAPTAPAVQKKIELPEPSVAQERMREEYSMGLMTALKRLDAVSQQLGEQARSDALEIGFAVAKKILENELSTSVAPLFNFIRAAIRKIGETRPISVRLNPMDLDRVSSSGGLNAMGLGLAKIDLVGDVTLKTGDCVIDGEFGSIDGRLATRLDEVHRIVAEELAETVP